MERILDYISDKMGLAFEKAGYEASYGKVTVTIAVRNHHFTTIKAPSQNPRATMEFASVALAHDLFNGTAATMNEMCKGNIRLRGMISMVDNINRILDRVGKYLA